MRRSGREGGREGGGRGGARERPSRRQANLSAASGRRGTASAPTAFEIPSRFVAASFRGLADGFALLNLMKSEKEADGKPRPCVRHKGASIDKREGRARADLSNGVVDVVSADYRSRSHRDRNSIVTRVAPIGSTRLSETRRSGGRPFNPCHVITVIHSFARCGGLS